MVCEADPSSFSLTTFKMLKDSALRFFLINESRLKVKIVTFLQLYNLICFLERKEKVKLYLVRPRKWVYLRLVISRSHCQI